MSLFGALSEFVGGAVLAAAPACDLALAAGVVDDRTRFLAWLGERDEMQIARAAVEAIGREMWVGAETRGLAQRDLEMHVEASSVILVDVPPAAALLAEVASTARSGGTASGLGETLAQRLAVDIVGRARRAGVFAGSFRGAPVGVPLREDVVQFLLRQVFIELIDGGRLMQLGPALSDYANEQDPADAGARSEATEKSIVVPGISRALTLQLKLAGGSAFLADLTERLSLSERALHRVIALVDGQPLHGAARIGRIETLARWLSDVRAQLLKPANDDPEMRRLKTAAAAALADGDFEAALEDLRRVRRELREMRRRTEERLQDEAVALRAQMIDEARATARLAELLQARGEHAQAADLFSEAAMALPRADRNQAWRFDMQRAEALLQHARERGDQASLGEAIATYGQLVRGAADLGDSKALGQACLGHGDALLAAGERETGTGRLTDAIAIYQKALQLFEREGDAANTSQSRLGLARAMARAGERDGSISMLKEAAAAYREAAAGLEASNSDMAAIKLGLGGVLLAIEEREGGAPLLAEAVDVYSAALGIMDREADADRWGEAQMNLGLALLGLGEQQGSANQLQGAIDAFKAALDVTARVRAPQRWALTQMNLGNALAALGDRNADGSGLLGSAIEAYNLALEELPREAAPLKWAITQMNLGTALIRLGERQDRRRHWLAAAAALVPALEVFEQQGATQLGDMTRQNLNRFHESWDSFLAPPGAPAAAPPASADTAQRSAARPRLAKAG